MGQTSPVLPIAFPLGDVTQPANKIYMFFGPFCKASMCNLLVASLKDRINVFVWLQEAADEGICMLSKCQDGTDAISMVRQVKPSISFFKR